MAVSVPANAEIVAGFEASIPEAEKAVIMAARNVATYAEQRGDVDVLRIYANLQFFITQVEGEWGGGIVTTRIGK